jgi:LacI family transcriptional regulator
MSTSWEWQTAFTTRAAQIDPLTADLVLLGDYSVEWGRAAAGRILDRWPDVDAMVCANDLIGIGVLQELHRRGVPVPGRVAVTGFDDTLLAAASEPSLTSVRQPVARMAQRAVEIVSQGVANDTPVHISMTAEIIFRASSGGPKNQ